MPTLSEAAYIGLYTNLVDTPQRIRNPNKHFNKQHRHNAQPVYDGFGIAYHSQVRDIHKEGLSHALYTLSVCYQNLSSWLDTRPNHVQRHHADQIDPNLSKLQDLKEAGFSMPSPTYRARWCLEPTKSDILFADEDDTPWDDLDSQEQQLRLSFPSALKRRHFQMDQATIDHYYNLAVLHKMQPRIIASSYTSTAYLGVCLEAIGLGWLTPPEGYQEFLAISTNASKYREEFINTGVHRLYGNHAHTPWAMTIEQIDALLKPYNYAERVANGTAYNPTPTQDGLTDCETETETRRSNA